MHLPEKPVDVNVCYFFLCFILKQYISFTNNADFIIISIITPQKIVKHVIHEAVKHFIERLAAGVQHLVIGHHSFLGTI